jgi:hypothetical protein
MKIKGEVLERKKGRCAAMPVLWPVAAAGACYGDNALCGADALCVGQHCASEQRQVFQPMGGGEAEGAFVFSAGMMGLLLAHILAVDPMEAIPATNEDASEEGIFCRNFAGIINRKERQQRTQQECEKNESPEMRTLQFHETTQ